MTQNGWSYDYLSKDDTIHVKRGFWDKFIQYGEEIEKTDNSVTWKNMAYYIRQKHKFLTGIDREVKLLIDTEKCNSGFMKQFQENLRRIANDLIVLQKDSFKYDFKAEDSSANPKKTLFDACMNYQRGIPGFSSISQPPRCQCYSDYFNKILTTKEKKKYIKDYNSLVGLYADPPKSSNENDWRYYYVGRNCHN